MEFNPSKCNVIRIMPNKQRKVLTDSYFLRGQTLETTSASKYLGTTISSDLSWSTHVEDVAAGGDWTAGFLWRNFRQCTPKVKSATYTTMVLSTLEYASAVRDCHKQKDIRLLEKVQCRAARHVTNNYTDRSSGIVTSMLEVEEFWTLQTTNLPGDALQNQQQPYRHQPRKFLLTRQP